jgi:hypothetical protein
MDYQTYRRRATAIMRNDSSSISLLLEIVTALVSQMGGEAFITAEELTAAHDLDLLVRPDVKNKRWVYSTKPMDDGPIFPPPTNPYQGDT